MFKVRKRIFDNGISIKYTLVNKPATPLLASASLAGIFLGGDHEI